MVPQALQEGVPEGDRGGSWRVDTEVADAPHLSRLLGLGGERCGEEAAGQTANECASGDHWITSSARASSDGGIVSPRALAVLRLMRSSSLAGCSTGRSPGFAPRRILSMNVAERRAIDRLFDPYAMNPPTRANSVVP